MPYHTETRLRRADRDDLDVVLRWMEDPEFQYFLYGDPAQSQRQIRERIIMMLGRTAAQTMPSAIYLIIESKKDGPLGMLSLQHISWRNRSCSLDIFIGVPGRRAGIVAAVAVYRALEYCFDELNLHRVSAFIYAFNTASWRIFERAGARRELVLEKHILRDGELHDGYSYGLLREEFHAMRQGLGPLAGQVSLAAMIEAGTGAAP